MHDPGIGLTGNEQSKPTKTKNKGKKNPSSVKKDVNMESDIRRHV